MKTYKLVNVVFSVVTLSFLLSGCYPTGRSPVDESGIISENSAISQNNEPQYNNEVENLTVSVDLPESMINEVGAIDLSVRKWDNEAIKKELIGEKTITNDAQTPSDDFPDEIIQVYDTEDNWRLILESGRITFDNKELIGKYNYGYFSTAVEQLHFDKMPDELTGFSKSDAQKITMDLLDKLNLIYVSEPDIYAITCEMANEFLSQGFAADSDNGYAQWTKDDEIYILIYSLLYEDVPVITRSERIMGTDKYSPETYIKIVLSKNGIISLRCSGIYDENYEKGNSNTIKVDAKSALNSLVSSYSKRVLDPTVINDCCMVYLPTAIDGNTYTCSPFWEFEILTESSTGIQKSYEYINSETGISANDYN